MITLPIILIVRRDIVDTLHSYHKILSVVLVVVGVEVTKLLMLLIGITLIIMEIAITIIIIIK